MQTILLKLNNDKLSKEEILEIASETKRHDVLLQVMGEYPEREELILTLAEHSFTVTDYEYAKDHLSPGLVSKLKDIMLDNLYPKNVDGSFDQAIDHCYRIRKVYGPDHIMTGSAEGGIECLRQAISKYNRGKYNVGNVDEILDYMRGTIEGARDAISLMEGHPQWEDDYPDIYDDGDMLENAIESMCDLELIYKIARRIDPEDITYFALTVSLSHLPDEQELHRIIADKYDGWSKRNIEIIEKYYPDRTDLLEILKKKL